MCCIIISHPLGGPQVAWGMHVRQGNHNPSKSNHGTKYHLHRISGHQGWEALVECSSLTSKKGKGIQTLGSRRPPSLPSCEMESQVSWDGNTTPDVPHRSRATTTTGTASATASTSATATWRRGHRQNSRRLWCSTFGKHGGRVVNLACLESVDLYHYIKKIKITQLCENMAYAHIIRQL